MSYPGKYRVKGLENLEIRERVKTILTTVLLRSVRILRSVLETWGEFFLQLRWKTISKRWCEKLSRSKNWRLKRRKEQENKRKNIIGSLVFTLRNVYFPAKSWMSQKFCNILVSFLCLMAYQLFIGYLMPKPFS